MSRLRRYLCGWAEDLRAAWHEDGIRERCIATAETIGAAVVAVGAIVLAERLLWGGGRHAGRVPPRD